MSLCLYRMLRTVPVAGILMLLTGVRAQHRVTFSSQTFCAVTGSTVKIPCTFTKPDHSSVTKREWHRVQSTEEEPEDLRKDPQYSGRVSVSTQSSDCALTISNVRLKDGGVYNFRYKTRSSDWRTAPSGVHLTVTDLKVIVSGLHDWNKKLSCSANCTLSRNPSYIWYKNGRRVPEPYQNELDLYRSTGAGSYSCAVKGREELRSPAVCVFDKKSCWSVTYSTPTVCSLSGSSVNVYSYYTFPDDHEVTKVFWFVAEQGDGEEVDMKGDEEYQGRVQYTRTSQNNCSLRICNLRETDARIYTFRFYTDADRYKGEPGVSLSVTDLKVTVSNLGEGFKKLSCITNCTLSDNPTYIWYKNGRRVDNQDIKDLYLYDTKDTGRYSCAVRGHEDLPSPAASVTLWSVKYATLTICAPIGSSVDLYSYSTFPEDHKVTNRFWFVKKQSGGEGVMEDQGRVRYACISRNNCSMRIRNLTETDARIYTFRLDTDGGDYTGEPGVSLSVTDLMVTVSDRSEQNMTLSCNTTCTLSNDPTYIWYKNAERVSECKSASCSVTAVGGDATYSCAVKGRDDVRSPPVYSPKNTRAAVLPSGLPVKGGSVTLSCSSDANPPVLTFSWFKQRAATDTLLTQEQNYSISNISSQDSGLYYCTATNQLGRHNSTPVHLDMTGSLEGLKFSMVGLGVFLAVTLLLGALWLWKRHSSSMNGRSNNDQSGELQSAPVYASILSLNRRGRLVSDDQENVAYSSVVFKPSDTQVGSRSCGFPPDPTDEEVVQYAAVNVHGSAAAAQLVADEADEDSSRIYSKVQRVS